MRMDCSMDGLIDRLVDDNQLTPFCNSVDDPAMVIMTEPFVISSNQKQQKWHQYITCYQTALLH